MTVNKQQLEAEAYKAYLKAIEPAYQAFLKIEEPAEKAFRNALESTQQIYQKTGDSNQYLKATSMAEEELQKITRPAWDAYLKARAPADQAYQKRQEEIDKIEGKVKIVDKGLFDILEGDIAPFGTQRKHDLAQIQKMVDSGEVWGFQGYIGRMVHDLIEEGELKYPSHRTYDYWGNPLPTAEEFEKIKAAESRPQVAQKMMIKPPQAKIPLQQKAPRALLPTKIKEQDRKKHEIQAVQEYEENEDRERLRA